MVQSLTDVSFTLPEWQEVLSVLTFRAGYNSAIVVAGSALLGFAGGIVGTFALLRKRALVGDAIAHCSLPGIALAFIVSVVLGGGERNVTVLLAGAACSGIAGVLMIQWLTQNTRLTEDAAIASVLSTFFAFGVALLSIIQSLGTGQEAGLSRFIYGQTAAMRLQDAQVTFGAAVIVIVVALLLFKEFRLLCFDRDFAEVQGRATSALDVAMMGLVVLVTVIGLQSVGLLLVVSLLIVPAAAARFWCRRLTSVVCLSAVFGAVSGYLGAVASSLFPRFPAGAVIVLVAGALFLVSMFFAPQRGVFARGIHALRLSIRIGKDHILRDAYEQIETTSGAFDEVPLQSVSFAAALPTAGRWLLLTLMNLHGISRRTARGPVLTAQGFSRARQLTRNHRLWEEFVFSQGHVSLSHVDYSADLVEHVLSPELVVELEQALIRRGRLSEDLREIPSRHPIDPSRSADAADGSFGNDPQ